MHAGIAHAFYRDVAARRWKLNLGVRHAVEWEHEDALVLHRMGIELRDFLGALDGGDDDEPGEPETQHEPDRIDTLAQGLPASVRRALRRWSITDWWTASDRWHQRLVDAGEHHGASVSRYANVDELMHWPALLSPFTVRTPTALRRIEFLTNSTLLVEEGTAMNHCVSIRVDDCLTERLHIASVRDGDGRRCSTLALRLDCVGGQWCVVQVEHLTAHNRSPDVACVHAVEQLMAKLKQPVWQQHFTENEVARVERETSLRSRLPERRQRTNSLRHAALKAALPEHLFLQLNLHEG